MKKKIPSDITFMRRCDLSDRAKIIKNHHGALHFTDSLPAWPLPEPIFLIFTTSKEFLPITICHMPPEFQMAEGESRDITFSGNSAVYADNVEAGYVPWELYYLKFEKQFKTNKFE